MAEERSKAEVAADLASFKTGKDKALEAHGAKYSGNIIERAESHKINYMSHLCFLDIFGLVFPNGLEIVTVSFGIAQWKFGASKS